MIEKTSRGYSLNLTENRFFLERPRIDAILEKAVKNHIVAVIAGAGYGKSRAVYDFAGKFNARTTWIQLTEADNDSEHFWQNFVNAITTVSPDFSSMLIELGFPATERQFSRYLSAYRNEVKHTYKYLIVYDDIHLIHNRAVLDFLWRRISLPFHNVTSIFISRLPLSGGTEDGVLLDLTEAESEGLVSRVTEDDLRFTKNEIFEFLNLLGLRLSVQTISDICRDTDGWAFALSLTGFSIRNNKNTYVPGSLRPNIYKLMESEIYANLAPELKKFLIKLTLIEYLDPDLLAEIAGDSSLIDSLEQICSFVRFDAYLNAYRIHHLFFDFLKERLHELSDGEKKEVWEKAALWCLNNNYKLDAIGYYEKCGDYQKLLNAVYTFPLMLPRQAAATLLRIMEAAPKKLYEEMPEAWITRIRLPVNLGMLERAEKEIKTVIPVLEAGKITPPVARTLAGCYNTLGFLGYFGVMHTGDYSFIRHFEQAHHYSDLCGFKAGPPVTVFSVSSCVCRVASAEPGEMERHNEALSQLVYHYSASMNGSGWGLDDIAWGELAVFRTNLADAEKHFRKAIKKAREKCQYEIENCALHFLLRINLYRGNGEAISEILRQIEDMQNIAWYLNRSTYRDLVYGWLYAQIGQPDKIAPWLKSGFEESDLNSLVSGLEVLVRARYQFAKKRYPAALADLASRDNKYSVFTLLMYRLEVKVLEAVCRYRMNDTGGAFRDLEAAWELAQSNGFFAPFAERGKDMRALAAAAIKDGSLNIPKDVLEKIGRAAASYAKNILQASKSVFGKTGGRKKTADSVSLSPREMDVLAGLSQGLTREEIARVLSISINTVKSAARSVFMKLGAVNRADAVRIAAERGLLTHSG